MEKDKIIIKTWDDLIKLKIDDYYCYSKTEEKNIFITILFSDYNIQVNPRFGDIKKIIDTLNALGGNFEYKPIEIIDTLEKWEEFQLEICKSSYYYDRTFGEFVELRADYDDDRVEEVIRNDINIKEIEQKYNVDLKILK